MRTSTIRGSLLLLPLLALAQSSCMMAGFKSGGHDDSKCPEGSAGCFCGPAGACDPGLICLSDRCVDAGGTAQDSTPNASVETSKEASSTTASSSQTGSAEPSDGASTQDEGERGRSSSEPEGDGARCDDGQKNAQETDVDCGGPDCAPCKTGLSCELARDCRSGQCVDQRCVAQELECTRDEDCEDQNPCTDNTCSPARRCETSPRADGTPCNDADACTTQDRCQQGACEGKDTRVLRETFSKAPYRFLNHHKSSMSHWEIAEAKPSNCAAKGFLEDPARDHTQDAANGLMGVTVGGCQTTQQDNFEDCTWSDFVDVSHFEGDVLFSYWRHLSSPGRDPVRQTIPLVTNSIYYRLEGATNAQLIESGWPKATNDAAWKQIGHRVSSSGEGKISFGICYKRLGSKGGYAGWSVDDVYVRQFGCENDR